MNGHRTHLRAAAADPHGTPPPPRVSAGPVRCARTPRATAQEHRRTGLPFTPWSHTPRRAPYHPQRFVKFTAIVSLDWSIAVKAEPTTLAVLFWLDAPAPVATCWVVVEAP